MNSLRQHVSKTSIHLLLGLGFLALIVSGYSFIESIKVVFEDINRDIAPALVIHKARRSPPPFTEVVEKTLSLGDTGKEVLILQSFLKWRGFWPEGEPLSEYFGEITKYSVISYQESNKIPSEGIVGPLTREMWKKDIQEALK